MHPVVAGSASDRIGMVGAGDGDGQRGLAQTKLRGVSEWASRQMVRSRIGCLDGWRCVRRGLWVIIANREGAADG